MKKIQLLFLCLISTLFAKAQSTDDYILSNAYHAQYLMQKYGLPASIVLGVAIHESAAGKSKIARYLNNHFGIKGSNSNEEIKSAYRDYPSVDSSYAHFVSFLLSRKYFNVLFDKYNQFDYKGWALGIQKGGYASSRTWANQVIAIIKKYELFQYDNRPENYFEPELPLVSVTSTSTIKRKIYIVKSGDNLGTIAKRNHTTVANLMHMNGLKSTALKLGQKLKL